jgi:hypothetical protein
MRVQIHPAPRAKSQGESHEISIDRIVVGNAKLRSEVHESKAVKSNGTLEYELFKRAQRGSDNKLQISKCNLVK